MVPLVMRNCCFCVEFKDMCGEKRRNGELAAAREAGLAEAQTEIARKFKILGVDIDTIVQATGLDKETVESL